MLEIFADMFLQSWINLNVRKVHLGYIYISTVFQFINIDSIYWPLRLNFVLEWLALVPFSPSFQWLEHSYEIGLGCYTSLVTKKAFIMSRFINLGLFNRELPLQIVKFFRKIFVYKIKRYVNNIQTSISFLNQ